MLNFLYKFVYPQKSNGAFGHLLRYACYEYQTLVLKSKSFFLVGIFFWKGLNHLMLRVFIGCYEASVPILGEKLRSSFSSWKQQNQSCEMATPWCRLLAQSPSVSMNPSSLFQQKAT